MALSHSCGGSASSRPYADQQPLSRSVGNESDPLPHLPKKRCVKVAMKATSMNKPKTASTEAVHHF